MALFHTRSYVGVTVTLTAANTNYNLLQLVNAVLAAQTGVDQTMQCPGMARQISLQAFPGVDGVGGNTNDILVGDAKLSATNMAFVLSSAGGTYSDRSTYNNVNLGDRYVRSAGAGQQLNVEMIAG